MDREMASRAFVDFFTLRPVFTAWGLKVVWVIFLLFQAYGVFGWLYGIANSAFHPTIGYWLSFTPAILPIIVNILLVRVLLEVAAAILLRRQTTD